MWAPTIRRRTSKPAYSFPPYADRNVLPRQTFRAMPADYDHFWWWSAVEGGGLDYEPGVVTLSHRIKLISLNDLDSNGFR